MRCLSCSALAMPGLCFCETHSAQPEPRENGKHSPNVARVVGVHEMHDIEDAQALSPSLRCWGVGLHAPFDVENEYLEELRMALHTAAQNWCHGMNRKRILER